MKQIDEKTFEVDTPVWPDFLDNRPAESHKGTYGHALLIAGSYGKMGAAILAARACLRMGVGLLTVHVPRKGVDIMQVAVPEAMVSIDEDDTHFTHLFSAEELEKYSAIGIGPGLGTDSPEALRALLSSAKGKPIVMDADALNMLARMEDKENILRSLQGRVILTPHAKEFERLFGAYDSVEKRQAAQREISQRMKVVIVYKGHRTQTTGLQGEMYINTTGNPGMATAGSGDVLTGATLAIIAQNKENQLTIANCAVLGVWLHGKSGDFAAQKRSLCSVTAGDIVKNFAFVTMCR